MNPISPSTTDLDGYLAWRNSAGDHLDQLLESREQAVSLLAHPDPTVRLAAIESFKYLWHFDNQIAKMFFAIATEDCHIAVRYVAAASMLFMHLASKKPSNRQILEVMLRAISDAPFQLDEIKEDINTYLDIMGGAGKQGER